MAQTSLSTIPATPEQLQDLQGNGIMQGLVSPDGGTTFNPEYILSAADVSTFVEKTQTPVTKYFKKVTAGTADPVNNLINTIKPKNADDKFSFPIGIIHKIIGSAGLFVVDNTLNTVPVDIVDFIADGAVPTLNQKLPTIISEHYKTMIAALDPATAGVERQLSIMFMASTLAGLTAINVQIKQINAASTGATGNTAMVTSVFTGNANGFGSPLIIEDIDVSVVTDGASGLMANVLVSYSV